MSGTDWRALCEELVGWIERATRHYIQDPEVLIRARAALAMPEPVQVPDCERNWDSILSPSGGYEMAEDAALRDGAQLVNGEWWAPVFGCDSLESALGRIRERLQRQAAPVPVAVSERLPGAEDCLDEGWAWFFSPRVGWRQAVLPVSAAYTHWLPADALPLPSGEPQP